MKVYIKWLPKADFVYHLLVWIQKKYFFLYDVNIVLLTYDGRNPLIN